jgi:hypothetical protein
MYMCPVRSGFRGRATGISIHSSKTVDKKDILRAVCNTGIYIFENSTDNINAFCSSCEDMALSRKLFGIGHMYIYIFMLRMTDTVTSQNADRSSWNTPYVVLALSAVWAR